MAVYFIRDNGHGYVKIGYAINPWNRLTILQCATPYELQIIRVVQGGPKVEAWFHRRFAKQRVKGEWFEFINEMLTIAAPDEIPEKPKAIEKFRSVGAYLRSANKLGLLTEEMQREFKPLLDSNA